MAKHGIAGLLMVLLLAAGPSAAAAPLAADSQGRLRFPTASYDSLPKLAARQPLGEVEGVGDLLLPAGDGRVPAVVILHTIGGPSPTNEAWIAERLVKAGFAAFTVDTYGPRGWTAEMAVKGGTQLNPGQVADALNALKLLAGHPRVDAKRIAVIGFSMGGDSAHYAAFEALRKGVIADDLRFAAHIPFYPGFGWGVRAAADAYTGAAVLFLIGEKDDAGPPAKVRAYLDYHKAAGSGAPLEMVVYPGAFHSWTMPKWDPPKFFPQHSTLKACTLLILDRAGPAELLADGTVRPVDLPKWRGCMASKGYHQGFSGPTRDRSLADAIAFLRRAMPE